MGRMGLSIALRHRIVVITYDTVEFRQEIVWKKVHTRNNPIRQNSVESLQYLSWDTL